MCAGRGGVEDREGAEGVERQGMVTAVRWCPPCAIAPWYATSRRRRQGIDNAERQGIAPCRSLLSAPGPGSSGALPVGRRETRTPNDGAYSPVVSATVAPAVAVALALPVFALPPSYPRGSGRAVDLELGVGAALAVSGLQSASGRLRRGMRSHGGGRGANRVGERARQRDA